MSPMFRMTSNIKEREITGAQEVVIDILLSPGGVLAGIPFFKPCNESTNIWIWHNHNTTQKKIHAMKIPFFELILLLMKWIAAMAF